MVKNKEIDSVLINGLNSFVAEKQLAEIYHSTLKVTDGCLWLYVARVCYR